MKTVFGVEVVQNCKLEVFEALAGGGGEAESLVGFDAEAEEFFVGQRLAEVGFV